MTKISTKREKGKEENTLSLKIKVNKATRNNNSIFDDKICLFSLAWLMNNSCYNRALK